METLYKECTRCGLRLEASKTNFNGAAKGRYGLQSWCKACERIRNRVWAEANREKLRAATARWRERNRAAVNAADREKYWRDPETARERVRTYRKKNPEVIRAYNQYYNDACYEKKKELVYQWRRENPSKVRAIHNRRRCRKKAAGDYTGQEVERQMKNQKNKCYWCKGPAGENFEVDHVIPLSRGGRNTADNIVIACRKCNRRKQAKMPWEWEGGNGMLL